MTAVVLVPTDTILAIIAVMSLESPITAGTVFFILHSFPADSFVTKATVAIDAQIDAMTAHAPFMHADNRG